MARASNLTMCSFCGKSHSEVRKLIAGPGVYICDSCIVVCKNILDKEINEDQMYKLELDSFMKLIETQKTQERIFHTLKTGKPLIN